jgi:hypothetical protein
MRTNANKREHLSLGTFAPNGGFLRFLRPFVRSCFGLNVVTAPPNQPSREFTFRPWRTTIRPPAAFPFKVRGSGFKVRSFSFFIPQSCYNW